MLLNMQCLPRRSKIKSLASHSTNDLLPIRKAAQSQDGAQCKFVSVLQTAECPSTPSVSHLLVGNNRAIKISIISAHVEEVAG